MAGCGCKYHYDCLVATSKAVQCAISELDCWNECPSHVKVSPNLEEVVACGRDGAPTTKEPSTPTGSAGGGDGLRTGDGTVTDTVTETARDDVRESGGEQSTDDVVNLEQESVLGDTDIDNAAAADDAQTKPCSALAIPHSGRPAGSTAIVPHATKKPQHFDSLFECSGCKRFTHYTACRVMSKAQQTYRCNVCHNKARRFAFAKSGTPLPTFRQVSTCLLSCPVDYIVLCVNHWFSGSPRPAPKGTTFSSNGSQRPAPTVQTLSSSGSPRPASTCHNFSSSGQPLPSVCVCVIVNVGLHTVVRGACCVVARHKACDVCSGLGHRRLSRS